MILVQMKERFDHYEGSRVRIYYFILHFTLKRNRLIISFCMHNCVLACEWSCSGNFSHLFFACHYYTFLFIYETYAGGVYGSQISSYLLFQTARVKSLITIQTPLTPKVLRNYNSCVHIYLCYVDRIFSMCGYIFGFGIMALSR